MNPIQKMAWRNIWRNPRRSILTLMAIALSCVFLVFMLSFQHGSYQQMIRAAVSLSTGEVQILGRGYHENSDIWKTIRRPDPLVAAVTQLQGIDAVVCRAETFALVSSEKKSYGIMVMGIDPVEDPGISQVDQTIRQGSYFTGAPGEALLGQKLAENLKISVGEEIVVLGQGLDGSVAANVFNVVGLFQSGNLDADRNLMRIPLRTFQDTFFMDESIHRIVINSRDFSDPDGLKERVMTLIYSLGLDYDVLTWDELMPGLKQSIDLDKISGVIIYLLLLIIVAFSIMNTFLMAILERTREFGVIMAIGTSRKRLFRMLFLETLFLALTGLVIGTLLGIGVTAIYQSIGIDFGESGPLMEEFGMPSKLYPKMNWITVSLGPAFVFLFTMLSAVYPIMKVKSLNLVSAMRSV